MPRPFLQPSCASLLRFERVQVAGESDASRALSFAELLTRCLAGAVVTIICATAADLLVAVPVRDLIVAPPEEVGPSVPDKWALGGRDAPSCDKEHLHTPIAIAAAFFDHDTFRPFSIRVHLVQPTHPMGQISLDER